MGLSEALREKLLKLNGGEIGVNAAIGEFVGEAVDTMPIFFWLITEAAIGIDAELAVCRATELIARN